LAKSKDLAVNLPLIRTLNFFCSSYDPEGAEQVEFYRLLLCDVTLCDIHLTTFFRNVLPRSQIIDDCIWKNKYKRKEILNQELVEGRNFCYCNFDVTTNYITYNCK
jgi:hypothetical protein